MFMTEQAIAAFRASDKTTRFFHSEGRSGMCRDKSTRFQLKGDIGQAIVAKRQVSPKVDHRKPRPGEAEAMKRQES